MGVEDWAFFADTEWISWTGLLLCLNAEYGTFPYRGLRDCHTQANWLCILGQASQM